MTRRNQARRRRTYGRRQHEVRERQPGNALPADWMDAGTDSSWSDGDEGRGRGGNDEDNYGSYEE
jgi:hypothetical protein